MALIERSFPRYDLDDPHRHLFRNLRDEADKALRHGIAQATRMAIVAEQLRRDLNNARTDAGGEG
jgi:hypothetical protein